MSSSKTLRAAAVVAMLGAYIFAGLCPRALFAAIIVSGTVTVDGAVPKGPVTLEAASKHGRLSLTDVNKDGRYSVTVDMPEGGQLVLRPFDEACWRGRSQTTLIGQAVAPVPDNARSLELDVRLKSVRVLRRSIRIMTEDTRRVRKVSVKCQMEMSGPDQGAIPPQTWEWTEDGVDRAFSVGVPQFVSGSFTFTMDAVGRDKARYVGHKKIAFDVLKGGPSMSWVVTRKPLSLEARFKWDHEFSKEPFLPDVANLKERHGVVLNGLVRQQTILLRQQTIMDSEGVARFYALPAGEYSLDLTNAAKAMYSLKQAAESVNIAGAGRAPTNVGMLIAPVEPVQLSGRIIDAADRSPVKGVVVSGASSTGKTSADGRFLLKGAICEGSAILVEHRFYPPNSFKVTKAGDQGDIRIKSFPSFTGTVRHATTGSGVRYAVLECTNAVNNEVIKIVADRDGNFATRLPSGKYQLVIKSHFRPGDGRLIRFDEFRPVIVYESPLEVPPEGLRQQSFKVSGVGELTVTITNYADLDNSVKMLVACLMRPADKKLIALSQMDADKGTVVLAATEGDYRLLVMARNMQTGQVCGDVKIEGDVAKKIAIALNQWTPMILRPGRIVEVGEQ